MSTLDRFDRAFQDALADLAATRTPDYIDDAIRHAVARRQRPSWAFPERWLPMNTLARRPAMIPALPWRTVGLLVLLAILLAAIVAVGAGSLLKRAAPPYGPAANGAVVYSVGGDLYARDLASGNETLLVGGAETDIAPGLSRDGTKLSFIRVISQDHEVIEVMAVNADGSDVRTLIPAEPAGDWHWSQWSPDSKLLIVQNANPQAPQLSVVNVEGAPVRREIELPSSITIEGFDWRPGTDELILRGLGEPSSSFAALYAVGVDGSNFRRLTDTASSDRYLQPFSLSHDGRLVASTRWGTDALYVSVLDLDSGVETTLLGAPRQGWPVFAPDSSRLAFVRYSGGATDVMAQAFVVPADGNGTEATAAGPEVAIEPNTQGLTVQFSPDGKTLVVTQPDESRAWLVDLQAGSYEAVPWAMDEFGLAWQRLAP